MASSGAVSSATPGKGPLFGRLRAWWEGTEIESAPGRAVSGADEAGGEVCESPTVAGWPRTRIDLIQRLFGPGMATPGGDAACDRLTADLVMAAGGSIVVLGAGLGGFPARVATSTGATVMAVESDLSLAEGANRWLDGQEPRPAVAVERRDLLKAEVRPQGSNAVLAKEALLDLADKGALFQRVASMLKPDGVFSFSDYVLTGVDPFSPEIAVWQAHEPGPVHLMSEAALIECLLDSGFEAPAVHDLTADYCTAVMAAFATVAERLREMPDEVQDVGAWLVCEAEHWTRRVALLNGDDVKVRHFVTRLRQGDQIA